MSKHVDILAWLHIVVGAFGLMGALIVFVTMVGGGMLAGDADAFLISGTMGTVIGLFLAVLSLPAIIAGVGLLRRAPWARVLTLIVAVIELLNFPIGTALGIYAFWVLLQDETKRMFSQAPFATG